MNYDLSELAQYDADYRAAFDKFVQVIDAYVSRSGGKAAQSIATNPDFQTALSNLLQAGVAADDGDEEAYAEWEGPLHNALVDVVGQHCVRSDAAPLDIGSCAWFPALTNLEMVTQGIAAAERAAHIGEWIYRPGIPE